MSTYCYQLPTGEIREEDFPIGMAPAIVRFSDGLTGERCISAEWMPPRKELRGITKGWPIESYSMGVHPDDRFTAMQDAADHGVPTTINERGNPELRNPSHARRYRKYLKAHDRDGFFD